VPPAFGVEVPPKEAVAVTEPPTTMLDELTVMLNVGDGFVTVTPSSQKLVEPRLSESPLYEAFRL
jgi:hypothetical protein